RQRLVASHKARIDALRLANDFNVVKALQHFFPDDPPLQLGQPHADATMNAEAKRQVSARLGTIDDEAVSILDDLTVAIARDIPHHYPVALLDVLAAELRILERSPPHKRRKFHIARF